LKGAYFALPQLPLASEIKLGHSREDEVCKGGEKGKCRGLWRLALLLGVDHNSGVVGKWLYLVEDELSHVVRNAIWKEIEGFFFKPLARTLPP